MRTGLLEKITMQEKHDWVNGDGCNTYIGTLCKMMPDFIETSCLITAAALRKRITPTQPFWTILETQRGEYIQLSKSFLNTYRTFEIDFGCNEDYDSHALIVHDDMIYQSFFKRFDWECKQSPLKNIKYMEKDIVFDKQFVDVLVGEGLLSEPHYDYVLSVPVVRGEPVLLRSTSQTTS
jgi:hypothetical protein